MKWLFAWGTPHNSRLWAPILIGVMASWGIVIGVVAGLYVIRKLRERRWPECTSKRRMEGKIVIVTGANTGIGWHTARELAQRGAIVILACRNSVKARKAADDIRLETTDGDLIIMNLDLADLASVQEFAANFCKKFGKLDVLINNAGVYVPPDMKEKTKDGFEIHFGVNHLGHFLLTNLLYSHIKDTPNSRIVNVSSELYKTSHLDFENLNGEKGWDAKKRNSLYCTSKLANILHSRELAKRLKGTNTGVFALSPGFVSTELSRYAVGRMGWITRICFAPVAFFFMRSARKGAQTNIHCAVSEELDGVEWAYLRDCKPVDVTDEAKDPEVAARLWDVSLRMVGECKPNTGAVSQDIGHQEAVGHEVGPIDIVKEVIGQKEIPHSELVGPEIRRREVAQQDAKKSEGVPGPEVAREVPVAKEVTPDIIPKEVLRQEAIPKEVAEVVAKETEPLLAKIADVEAKMAPEVGRVFEKAEEMKKEGLAKAEEMKKEGLAKAEEMKKDGLAKAEEIKKDGLAKAEEMKKDGLAKAEEMKKDGLAKADEIKKGGLAMVDEIKKGSLAMVGEMKGPITEKALSVEKGEKKAADQSKEDILAKFEQNLGLNDGEPKKKVLPAAEQKREDVLAKLEQNLGESIPIKSGQKLEEKVEQNLGNVSEEAKKIVQKAEENVDIIKDTAIGGVQDLGAKLSKDAKTVFETVGDKVESVKDAAIGGAQNIGTKVLDEGKKVESIKDAAIGGVQDFGAKLSKEAKTVTETVGVKVESVKDAAIGKAEQNLGNLSNEGKKLMEKVESVKDAAVGGVGLKSVISPLEDSEEEEEEDDDEGRGDSGEEESDEEEEEEEEEESEDEGRDDSQKELNKHLTKGGH